MNTSFVDLASTSIKLHCMGQTSYYDGRTGRRCSVIFCWLAVWLCVQCLHA